MNLDHALTLAIPKAPRSGNATFHKHWRATHEVKEAWRVAIKVAIEDVKRRVAPLPVPTQHDLEKWLVIVHWISRSPPTDTHPNCCSALKPVFDLLTRGDGGEVFGLLANDDDEHLLQDIRKRKPAPGEPQHLALEFFRMIGADGRPVPAPPPPKRTKPRKRPGKARPGSKAKSSGRSKGKRRDRTTAAWAEAIKGLDVREQ